MYQHYSICIFYGDGTTVALFSVNFIFIRFPFGTTTAPYIFQLSKSNYSVLDSWLKVTFQLLVILSMPFIGY